MKKFYAVPLAAFIVVACSEPTATSTADLTVRYAKPGPPPTAPCASCPVVGSYDFEAASISSGTTSFSTELQPGITGTADAPAIQTAPGGNHTSFLGRFENVRTVAVLNVAAGYSQYSLTFDLYTIGSWDGKGRQAQHGVFQANVFSIGYRCSDTGPVTSIFASTFSNQLTVQQDYPLDISAGGGSKAATGSYGQDLLGYRDYPLISNTPTFRSFGDVEYTLSFAGANPCGTGAIDFVFSTSNPTQQSNYDESWGIDNVTLKAGA
ncbi:MAG: hypothetical protein ABI681_01565 [Gemmatimonadales bacterium]